MTKLPISRIFDTALIAKTKSYAELEPFLVWVQETLDTFFRALNGKLTVGDNIDGQYFTVRLRGSASQSVNLALRARPQTLIVAQQVPTTPAITSFTWEPTQTAQTRINVTFSAAPTDGVEVKVLAIY